MLVSPHFLFRVELDADTSSDAPVQKIDNHQLASRLSYFLWSTMPDEELFRLAEQGLLERPDVLGEQVRRMIADPRSQALVENFAGQWLQIRNLSIASPDRQRFKGFDEFLRHGDEKETELFCASIMREDRSIVELLDADYTFLNERLAKHYGIEGVSGDEFRRVPLTDRRRGGVLTQASVLLVTSNPTRTSPVKRGKWIMEQILGTPPPPPPPGVQELEKVKLEGTLRQKMEQHRANPSCAVCHARMDPLGFAFENFDAIGAWRDRDDDHEIDPSGVLPGGQTFSGATELRALLAAQARIVRSQPGAEDANLRLGPGARGLRHANRGRDCRAPQDAGLQVLGPGSGSRPQRAFSNATRARNRVMTERRHVSRRTVLKGLGTALALPMFDAMLPVRAGAETAALSVLPRRLAFIYIPNGVHLPDWTPQATGAGFDLPSTLAPLAPHQDYLTVFSGLAQDKGAPTETALGITPGRYRAF